LLVCFIVRCAAVALSVAGSPSAGPSVGRKESFGCWLDGGWSGSAEGAPNGFWLATGGMAIS
jgi:hypothetical protein